MRSTESPVRELELPGPWPSAALDTARGLLAQDAFPRRALVVGPAGSGKSALLRAMGRTLSHEGARVVFSHRGLDISALESDALLLIDDVHLLEDQHLDVLIARLEDPDAEMVVAQRPGPVNPRLREIDERLARTGRTIVLGHVTSSELRAHVIESNADIDPDCVARVAEMTAGVAWLVTTALRAHDPATCRDDAAHTGLAEGMQSLIAHRLDALDDDARGAVARVSLGAGAGVGDVEGTLLDRGYAEGLLARGGRSVPVVASAVRATARPADLVALLVDGDAANHAMLGGLRDPRLAEALLREGDATLPHDAARAAALYRTARECGADLAVVSVREAQAAWASGDLDAAARRYEPLAVGSSAVRDVAADGIASVWAARGLLTTSDALYGTRSSSGPVDVAHEAVAALGVGDRTRFLATVDTADALEDHSTEAIAARFVVRGLRAVLDGSLDDGLDDLVRASHVASSSTSCRPAPEETAVLAAVAALHAGEPDVADAVLREALGAGQGGPGAQDRLQLWFAWTAVQRTRPAEAETALRAALSSPRRLSPRDGLLADAVAVALARRYDEEPVLRTAWRQARASLRRVEIDVYSILPLAELVVTAARLGESDRVATPFARALALVDRLDSPFWAAAAQWAGIQRGILLSRPDDLKPHARALLRSGRRHPVAAVMASAGRVWTEVLTGHVDADAVEENARGLASIGLAWDGARLAALAGNRLDDKRLGARLLSCARQLHPREEGSATPGTVGDIEPVGASTLSPLSAREREVAVLVVQGKTYAEIGEAIFISPRTAEHHIARIRRRLEATTRSDLIAKLRSVLEDGLQR